MSAQDDTLDRYHALIAINAQSHIVRTAREVGIFQALLRGQATAAELVASLDLEPRLTGLLLDALVAMKVVERYREDYALAAVAQLLCHYDADLGDASWKRLAAKLRGGEVAANDENYLDAAAATQWTHTGAAKQAAEILDIGGERTGLRVLDLGCGSAVWSAAIAYRDRATRVTAIDTPERLVAAQRTIASIALEDQFTLRSGDPNTPPETEEMFDLIILAGRLSTLNRDPQRRLLAGLASRLASGGELAIIDLFRLPQRSAAIRSPGITEAIEALHLATETSGGAILDPTDLGRELTECGLGIFHIVYLAASRRGWGMVVASRSSSPSTSQANLQQEYP